MSNAIVTENQNTGTTAWNIVNATTTQIQAYADKTSLDAGQTINFFVSTISAGTSYSMQIFRMGYYQGLGGCLKATVSGRTGVAQGYWNAGNSTLNNCPTAIIDGTTHLCDAGWTSTDSWTVPSNACTGIYLAVFTDANSYPTVVVFVVRGKGNEDYVAVRPFLTDQAYSDWGGYSLYTNPTVGVKVSFNRPSVRANGGTNYFLYEVQSVKWLECMGYNLSYLSNIDVHTNASQLLNYGAYISLGHDEYWTKEIYDGVLASRNAGIGLAFLGANDCYWQVRLENDAASNPNRTVTCYKVQTANNNLSNDPKYGVDNTRVTTRWRDVFLNRPENTMVGIMYVDDGATSYAWTVDANANSPYLVGTGLVNNTSYGSDLVGGEWDTIFSGGPPNLNTIGSSPATGVNGAHTANTTTYIASSGSLVFAAGSFHWTWALDSFRYNASSVAVIPGMQQLMAHIMTALIRPKSPTGFSAFSSHL